VSGPAVAGRPAAPSAAGRPVRVVVAILLGIAAWHGGRFCWIEAKAALAQQLMLRAWRESQGGGGDVRPWPWADTFPVARLAVPRLGVEQLVLEGASGRTLAFGPGHLSGTPLPGAPGNAVISGHRDTHFAYLRRLRVGDRILVESRDGRCRGYVVEGARVVDRTEVAIAGDTRDTRLTLVTCYPFDAVRPGGPLRYVVVARADETRLDTAGSRGARSPNRLH
jgi:sortase A